MARVPWVWLVVLLQPLVWLWPLPVVAHVGLVGSGQSEVATHLWGWWMLGQEGALVGADTNLLGFPSGTRVQVIDPMHRGVFAIFAMLGGPTLGWAGVLLWGHWVAGLAGVMLAHEAGADRGGRVLGAVAAGTAAALVGVGADGITEGLGVGWVGIQLVLLLRLAREPTLRGGAVLAFAIGAAAWSGPYNAVWVALVDVPVGLWLLRRSLWPVVAGAVGIVGSLPVLMASWSQAADDPGGQARAGLELPRIATPWRGSVRDGADVLDLLLPDLLTGPSAAVPTTAYLGVALLALAVAGLWRSRRLAWAGGAVFFGVLALGPWLMLGGEVATFGGRPLLAPAGLLEGVPVLERMSRWYRAGAVAVLLLVPLASVALRGRMALVAALVVGLDARLGSPVPWPLPVQVWPESPAMADLEGPVALLPPVHPVGFGGQVAGLDLLLQVDHGQPSNGSWNNRPLASSVHPALGALRRVALGQVPDAQRARDQVTDAAEALSDLGFVHLVFVRQGLDPVNEQVFYEVLGAPQAADAVVIRYALRP